MRKVIALAVAGVFVSPTVFADSGNVTIYGKIRMGVEFLNSDANTTTLNSTSHTSQTKISSFKSRIGFKGEEDLGNGLKTVWQAEGGINADDASMDTLSSSKKLNGNGLLATRDTFVGLSDAKLGTLKLGRITSPYDNVGSKFDGFIGSDRINGFFEQNNTDPDSSVTNGVYNFPINVKQNRKNNAIHYTSPNLNGFSGAVEYYLNENATSTSKAGKGISTRLSYSGNGLSIDWGFEQNKTGAPSVSGSANKETANLVSIAYDVLPELTLGGQLYKQQNNAASKVENKGYGLFANYKATPQVTLRAFYGQFTAKKNDGIEDTNDFKAKRLTLGAHYALSKRTLVFAEYLNDKINRKAVSASTGNTSARTISIGLSHDF
ncbi:porin [Leeia sp. TBRC 13508]|uniref:Porin n=1 Tax=Leeia speluncae TaxID=2884804 RepID=A0ABS8D6T5_9NEIS|nr:porin [Leeia speluncae]MCB6183733.1 porin [Leeia speluncae]